MNLRENESKRETTIINRRNVYKDKTRDGYVLYVHKMGTNTTSEDLHRLFTQQWN
jgi:hypothetical protein